jgi:hypothetical protein
MHKLTILIINETYGKRILILQYVTHVQSFDSLKHNFYYIKI